jgi:hypothetical protein
VFTRKLPSSNGWRRAVLIGVSEGQGWRYEVVERPDDFLVRMRDLDTGTLTTHHFSRLPREVAEG